MAEWVYRCPRVGEKFISSFIGLFAGKKINSICWKCRNVQREKPNLIQEETWVFQKVLPELIIDGSEGNGMFLLDVSRLALMASARADLPEHSVKRHLSASVSLRVEKCGGL